MSEAVCDIVLLVWNHQEETAACLEAVFSNTGVPCRLLIVDNGSDAPTREWLQTIHGNQRMSVEVLRNAENRGSPGGFNRGLQASQAPYVCILSNDVQPAQGWLEELLAVAASDPRVGVVVPSSNTYGQKTPAGMTTSQFAAHLRSAERGWAGVNFGEFFCMVVSRKVIERIGLIDESYGMAYFDDTDYCRRAQDAGFLCVRAKAAYVFHLEGRSLKDTWSRNRGRQQQFDRAAQLFARRWGTPQRVAYVLTDRSRNTWPALTQDIRSQLQEFHRVWVFYRPNGALPELPDHDDLLLFPVGGRWFRLKILWRVLVKKKRFHRIVTARGFFGGALKALRPLHRANVLLRNV